MALPEVNREVLPDGAVRLSAGNCSFVFRRMKPNVLLIVASGHDSGQFGTATLDEIRVELGRVRPLEIFVDASEVTGASVSVSEEWTQFFSVNRDSIAQVHVLVGSKAFHLTVAIAQHLSRTGKIMQLHTDPAVFQAKLAATRSGH